MCKTEDFNIGKNQYKLAYVVNGFSPEPNQMYVVQANCREEADGTKIKEQFQLPSKKRTYVAFGEYVLTEDYIKQNMYYARNGVKSIFWFSVPSKF